MSDRPSNRTTSMQSGKLSPEAEASTETPQTAPPPDAAETPSPKPQEMGRAPLLPLREHIGQDEPNWKLSQFAPHAVWHETSALKRAVRELQDRVDALIEERNG